MKIKNFDTESAYLQFAITPNGISVEYRVAPDPAVCDYKTVASVNYSWLEIAYLHDLDLDGERETAFNMAAAAHLMCVNADFTENFKEEEGSDDE